MFTPMFDGQYRSKPKVSLSGASKQVSQREMAAMVTIIFKVTCLVTLAVCG